MNKYLKIIGVLCVIGVGVFVFLRLGAKSLVKDIFLEPTSFQEKTQTESGKALQGKKIPYFDLLSLYNKRVRQSDLLLGPVVLVFWSTWNEESVDQIKILDDYLIHSALKNQKLNVQIIAINSQEHKDVVLNFMRRGSYDVPVLLDTTGEVSSTYGIQTLPTTFFVDEEGVLQEIFIGTLSERMIGDKIEKIFR